MNSWKEHYWHGIPVTRARIEEIVRRASIFGNKNIVEVGCNEGFLTKALQEAGHTVTSVDLDDAMIKKSKELFNIDAVKADINSLPFSDGSFDIAIGGEVLEHLHNPGKGLSELFRVAKERVIISLPIGAYWLGCADHKWCIDSTVVEHDQGIKEVLVKKVLVVEFIKRSIEAKGEVK